MSSVGILVSARMRSERCPGKAVALLNGRPLIQALLERLKRARTTPVVLATSVDAENDRLEELARAIDVPTFRGDENDVLKRHVDCARHFSLDHVVRVTGDNPLTDVDTIDRLVEIHLAEAADYTYIPGDALLMGVLSEVISRSALEDSWERGEERHRSELVTLFIKEHPADFQIRTTALDPALYRPELRLTVDEAEDVELMQGIFERLATSPFVTTRAAIELLEADPALPRINAHLRHRSANLRSVALDEGIAEGLKTS